MWFTRPPGQLCELGRTGRFLFWPQPYAVPLTTRQSHCHIVGLIGVGKSKFMERLIMDNLVAGRAIGLIDPHRDLAHDTLAHLLSIGYFAEEANYQKIIYLDPTREDFFIPFNILKFNLPPTDVAQLVIKAFKRTWPSLSEAPRFSNICLASLLVLIETGQSLLQMMDLLLNKEFRNRVLAQVRSPKLVDYFHSRFDQWGKETATWIESVLNKVAAYTFSPELERMLGAADNRLDFKRMMDSGQSFICNLGRCYNEETQRLLGSLMLTCMERVAITRGEGGIRQPWYLFIDEFHDFSAGEGGTETLARVLSDCRKFGLFLHLGHQGLYQIHPRLVGALDNVGLRVVFRVGRDDAVTIAPKLYAVNPEEIKHPAQTDTQHPLYTVLPEQWERWAAGLQDLPRQTAWVKPWGQPPVRMTTEPIAPYQVSEEHIWQLEERLAHLHGVARSEGERSGTGSPPAQPVQPVQPPSGNWED
jgi:hypothetical protein